MNVYVITNSLNNKCYVGQTIHSIEHRFHQHISGARNGYPSHLCYAIRKYGARNFEVKLLQVCSSKHELDVAEHDWIVKLDSFRNGYNRTDVIRRPNHLPRGKYHPRFGVKLSSELRSKIAEKTRAAMQHTDVKHHLKESQTVVVRKKKSDAAKIAWASEGVKNRHQEAEKRLLLSGKKGRKISQIDDTGLVRTFFSIREASRLTNVPRSSITACLNSKLKHAGGFVWMYV